MNDARPHDRADDVAPSSVAPPTRTGVQSQQATVTASQDEAIQGSVDVRALSEATAWQSLLLGGERGLVISWKALTASELPSEFAVAWRLDMSRPNRSLVQQGTLSEETQIQQIDMLPVYDDPNIRNGSVELRYVEQSRVSLWCDIPLGPNSFHQGTLQTWRILWPPPGPGPDPDLPPPDPFDPPVDNLGHRRLPWGSQIEPTAVLDFLWFDPPHRVAEAEVLPFAEFADGGSAAAKLPLLQDYATAIKSNSDPAQAYTAMQTAAVAFITANWAAWTAAQTLAANLGRTLDQIAALPDATSFAEMDQRAEQQLGMTPAEFVQTQVDAADGLFPLVWQLLYAIVIAAPIATPAPALEEALAATDVLARTARAMSLVCRLQRNDPALLRPEFRQRLPHALLVVPDGTKPPLPAAAGDVECLGVGIQKTIDQRLKTYRLGEIADVINVMPGEQLTLFESDRSEASTRENTREQDARAESRDDRATSSSDLAQTLRDALAQAEVNRNYTNLSITAGTAPDLIANGSWWGWDGEQGRKLGRAAHFVRSLSAEAANHMAKRVVQTRATATLREQESTQKRAIDNRRSGAPVCGVYHWLEKVYELRMRSNGRHVVLEFLLASPGDRLRSEAKSWPKLEPVLPPETWGISTEPDQYSSVTADNYASAAAAYGLTLPPPPPATAVVRAELASSSPSARLPIPPGYQANAVSISYVVSDATQVISAVVGTMPVTFSPTPMPAATSQSPATLSAAAVPSGPPAIPDPQGYGWTTPAAGVGTGSVTLPAQTTGEFPLACQYGGASFNLIVEAQCTAAGPAALTAWQVATHQKIITGYDQARVARDAAVMSAIVAVQASEGVGRLISRQLTLSALDALGKALPEPAGSTPAPDAQRFLTDALAWQQSTYAFYPSAVGTARRPSPVRWIGETVTDRNDPAWLRSFMQAASARMLVTVRRGYEVPLLFLLAFGYLPEPSRGVFTTAHGRLWLDQLLADDRNEPEECWHLYIPTEQAALVVNDAFGRSVRP